MADQVLLKATMVAGAIVLAAASWAQVAPVAPAQQQRGQVLDAYQGGWGAPATAASGKENADDSIFSLHEESRTAAYSLDSFRAQRNAALSRHQGQLTEEDLSQLRQQAVLINAALPNSFDGRMADFYLEFPAPSAWVALEAASRLQPDRIELIGPRLSQAMRSGDRDKLVPAAKDMKARGEVAPALYAFADDLLLSVDRDGILVVAGEMDGYPMLVRQCADGKRTDVLVIDHRLLEDAAYRSTAWKQAGASGAVPASAADFMALLHQRAARPVFLSLALGRTVAEAYADRLHVTGLALRMTSAACCDVKALDAVWKSMRKTTGAGPLSRNYLIPASALLKHYRSAGEERRASELEHDLRQLAQRLGATRELQANGIIPH